MQARIRRLVKYCGAFACLAILAVGIATGFCVLYIDYGVSLFIGCHLSLEMPPAVITSKPAKRLLSGIPHDFASPQATASAIVGSLAPRFRRRSLRPVIVMTSALCRNRSRIAVAAGTSPSSFPQSSSGRLLVIMVERIW